jgi:hypothetical protein
MRDFSGRVNSRYYRIGVALGWRQLVAITVFFLTLAKVLLVIEKKE